MNLDAFKKYLTDKLTAGIPTMVNQYVDEYLYLASQGLCSPPPSDPLISEGVAEDDLVYTWPEETRVYSPVTRYMVEHDWTDWEFLIAQEVGGRHTYGGQREAIVVFLRQGQSPQPIYEFTQTDIDSNSYACLIKQTKRHAADVEDYDWTQSVPYLAQASVLQVNVLFDSAGANAKTLRLVVNASDHTTMLLHALDKVERILKLPQRPKPSGITKSTLIVDTFDPDNPPFVLNPPPDNSTAESDAWAQLCMEKVLAEDARKKGGKRAG
jgi:hypothetical protein